MDISEQVILPFILNVSLNLAGFHGDRGWAGAVGCSGPSLPTKQSFLSERRKVVSMCMVLDVLVLITATHLHGAQSDGPASRWVSLIGALCCGDKDACTLGLGWTLRCSCFRSWWRLCGWSGNSLLGRHCTSHLLDGRVLWAQNRGGIWERRNWPGHTTACRAAFPGGAGRCVRVRGLLPAERVDPAGAVSGGKGGHGHSWEPHVLSWRDQLSKSFLVGKGVAGSPGTAPSTQTALWHAAQPTPDTSHATTHRLSLLLPHQLSVADLEKERGQEVWLSVVWHSFLSLSQAKLRSFS